MHDPERTVEFEFVRATENAALNAIRFCRARLQKRSRCGPILRKFLRRTPTLSFVLAPDRASLRTPWIHPVLSASKVPAKIISKI